MSIQRAEEFSGVPMKVDTFGVDADGYVMHRQYPEADVVPVELSAFVGFARIDKRHPDVGNERFHLVPLGKTFANGYGVACSVLLSHPPTRKKLATYAVEYMVVRSDLDMTLRLLVRVPPWAVDGQEGR